MKLIDYRILEDKDISAHYRREVEEGETEDSKQSSWTIHMPIDSIADLPEELRPIARELWTPDVIEAYKTKWGIQ